MVIIFSGPSGVGKNTVIDALVSDESGEFRLLPTFTTRKMRVNEREGYPYHFVDAETFKKRIEAGDFLEYQIVHENYYGTSKSVLEEKSKSGDILIKDIDVLGALKIYDSLNEKQRIITVFLYVDSFDILVSRLKNRGEKDIELRLNRFELEMDKAPLYNYLINNINTEETVFLVKQILMHESSGRYMHASKKFKIDWEKLYKIKKRMEEGQIFSPIKVGVSDGSFCILDGHYRYLASVLAGKDIAKELLIGLGDAQMCDELWWNEVLRETAAG